MDYEAVRAGMAQAVPFNAHLGLELAEIARGRAVVRLPDVKRLLNHVGSQHAGALFAAGEAASGGALVGGFAERLGELTPLAESAEISYRRIARGPIIATARMAGDVDAMTEALDQDGRVRFNVDVDLTDGNGAMVADMVVRWYVRQKDAD